MFITPYSGYLYGSGAATGAMLVSKPLSAGTTAPVAIDGRYLLTGADVPLPPSQHPLILACRPGATSALPPTVGP